MSTLDTIYQRPVEMLQKLIRIDTTNPPGNEAACINYLRDLLTNAGISTTILALDDRRPNLIARLPGRGDAPPLLLYGHVDVVTTAGQQWTHPPFAGVIADDMVWGRGALDMKSGIAMMTAAFLRAHAENVDLPGDVILAILADEEANGVYGARFLVQQHPEQFTGVRFAIGEGGGVTTRIGERKFYTIMVAEKQICSVRATLRGRAGHGSTPQRGGAMAQLGQVLRILDRQRLPVHVTPTTRQMLGTIADHLPFPTSAGLRLLLNPAFTDWILDRLGTQGALLNPLLHNTVSPTIVRGGDKINVIPAEVTLDLDGRLLPGFSPEDMLAELGALLGERVALEVTNYEPGPVRPDMTLYPLLADLLQQTDPDGVPIPILLSGVTDARVFAELGIQTYGYLPSDLPPGLIETIHAADERIPVTAVSFGADVIFRLLRQYRV